MEGKGQRRGRAYERGQVFGRAGLKGREEEEVIFEVGSARFFGPYNLWEVLQLLDLLKTV